MEPSFLKRFLYIQYLVNNSICCSSFPAFSVQRTIREMFCPMNKNMQLQIWNSSHICNLMAEN